MSLKDNCHRLILSAKKSLIERVLGDEIKRFRKKKITDDMTEREKWAAIIKNNAHLLNNESGFVDMAKGLWNIGEEAERPLLILVMGEFKNGKSTFINTILGEDVLTKDVLPSTAVVTLLRFGEIRQAFIHYADGNEQEWAFDDLSSITAEGNDSNDKMHQEIDYVEVCYPNKLLKKINIVDTPGLNVNKESHIKSTEHFQERADVVLWVFNAVRNVSRTEIAAISTLGERLRPLAIVNRIDNIDTEEESVDDVIARTKKRLKGNAFDVIGISAKWAQQAIQSNDNELLAQSRWSEFMQMFNGRITAQAEPLKIIAIEEKIAEYIVILKNQLNNVLLRLNSRKSLFSDTGKSRQELRNKIAAADTKIKTVESNIDSLQSARISFNGIISQASSISNQMTVNPENEDAGKFLQRQEGISEELGKIIAVIDNVTAAYSTVFANFLTFSHSVDDLPNGDKLKNNIEMYRDKATMDSREINTVKSELQQNHTEYDNFIQALRNWIHELHEWETSGLFGNKPIFDFSGRRARLLNNANTVDDFQNSVVCDYITLEQRLKNMFQRLMSVCSELIDVDRRIISQYETQKKQFRNELDNLQNNFDVERNKYLDDIKEFATAKSILSNIVKVRYDENIPDDIITDLDKMNKSLIDLQQYVKSQEQFKGQETVSKESPRNYHRVFNFILSVAAIAIIVYGAWYFYKQYNASDLTLNGICIDDSADTLRKNLGEAKEIISGGQGHEGEKCYVFDGIRVFVNEQNQVTYILSTNKETKTKRGIKIGDTVNKVMSSYDNDKNTKVSEFQVDGIWYREYNYLSPDTKKPCLLTFALQNGVVINIIAHVDKYKADKTKKN